MKKIILLLLLIAIGKNINPQWSRLTSLNAPITGFALKGNVIYVSAKDSGIYTSSNNGTNWNKISVNNQAVYSVAVKENYIFAGIYDYVCRSTDNGANWVQTDIRLGVSNHQSVTNLVVNSICLIAGTIGTAGYMSTQGYIALSFDNDTSWVKTLNDRVIYNVTCDSNIVYSGTNNGLYISTNYGYFWILSSLNLLPISCAVHENNIYIGTTYQDYTTGAIWFSTNFGSTWSGATLFNRTVNTIVTNENKIFIGLQQSTYLSGGVYFTENISLPWQYMNEGMGNRSVNKLFIANNYLFASASDLSVWRRPLSDFVSINNISSSIPKCFSLHQNYPNPFNPITNIKYDLPKEVLVSINIYDLLGRKIRTLVNEFKNAGSYIVSFNGSEFSSGIYFYRMTAGDFVSAKHMILIK